MLGKNFLHSNKSPQLQEHATMIVWPVPRCRLLGGKHQPRRPKFTLTERGDATSGITEKTKMREEKIAFFS